MTNAKQLSEDRFDDLQKIYSGQIPKRVPIHLSPAFEASISYGIDKGVVPSGKTMRDIYWEPEYWFDILDRVNADFYSDIPLGTGAIRLPIMYQILDAKCINMSATGVMQHPEVHSLEVEEYDEFCKDPMTFMMENLMPRLYKALDTTPGRRAMVIAEAVKANYDHMAIIGGIMKQLSEKYGFAKAAGGRSTAPFDYLADFLRSFSNINKDTRRCPEKVLEACDALVPLMLREGLGTDPESLPSYYRISIPLHMGSFLNNKQFEQFWYPSMKKVMDGLVKYGHGVDLFVEDDWMRHMEFMNSFTGSIRYQFEYGDPKYIKKLFTESTPKDSTHVITGFYPINLLQFGSKQEVIDKAKELVDILGPNGGYIFNFDKGLFSLEEPIASNVRALTDFMKEYAVY